MKKIHIRRFLSLLLAALTLWAAAVTAGSDSAAAALQQLRKGSRLPQQAPIVTAPLPQRPRRGVQRLR